MQKQSMPITIDGTTHTLAEWARINKIPVGTAYKRVHCYKWTPQEAVTRPTRTRKRNKYWKLYAFEGKTAL